MKSVCFSPLEKGYYNTLVKDYINQAPNTRSLYNNYFDKEGFEKTISNRKFSAANREILVQQLSNSYIQRASELQLQNIQLLKQENTFTVTTGHQLCLGTGPLYSIYKILTCIVYARKLKTWFPAYNFVSVFWMASEDHDIDEIKTLNFFGKEFTWASEQTGPTGRMDTTGISELLNEIKTLFANDEKTADIIEKVKHDYDSPNLNEATFTLINKLFKQLGLLVINPDNAVFKGLFTNYIIDDIIHHKNYKPLKEQTSIIEQNYKPQLFIRDINFFYLNPGKRERIKKEADIYYTNDKCKTWTEVELIREIQDSPENFSPNAAIRPLYQETILPNIAYAGGPGELAYWLQLYKMFEVNNIDFPVLLPRYSAVLLSKSLNERIEKLKLNTSDFLNDEKSIITKFMDMQDGSGEVTFSDELELLRELKSKIELRVSEIDATLMSQVDNLFKKNLEQLNMIETRLKNTSQKKYETDINKIKKLHEDLWPQRKPQERIQNYIQFATRFSLADIYDAFLNSDTNGCILIEE
ncbi:MAG: bacillithiol biosynthesis cysteine-adding enzyme BshC [Bacteroidota bacterium]|nr:bacillithiol biosynthesis cysteine-adding enzyme BshC [Bacteroidota bacterium]